MGIGDDIYSGAADVGHVFALLGAIVGSVIALILISVGIYMLTRPADERSTLAAWGFIGIGVLIGGVAWLIWYFTQKSKAFAAVEGAYGVAEAARDVFRY